MRSINKGEPLLIPFQNGKSISDSQLRPRMYKSQEAFERSYPKHNTSIEGVELVEYAPRLHGRWVRNDEKWYCCSECGVLPVMQAKTDYCPNCGAGMDKEA